MEDKTNVESDQPETQDTANDTADNTEQDAAVDAVIAGVLKAAVDRAAAAENTDADEEPDSGDDASTAKKATKPKVTRKSAKGAAEPKTVSVSPVFLESKEKPTKLRLGLRRRLEIQERRAAKRNRSN